MKKTWASLIAAIFVAVLIVMTAGCSGPVKNKGQLQSATESMQMAVQSRLSELDGVISEAAIKMARSGLKGDETQGILNGLCRKCPYLLYCSTADTQGKMATVAPEVYYRYMGIKTAITEASKQFLAELKANRKPVLSNMFRAAEGFDAIVLAWPVITENGELLGDVCALFEPKSFMENLIGPKAKAGGLKVNVMELSGMVNYCSTGTETGKNVLTDTSYKNFPELVAQAEKISAQKTGTGGYTYPGAAGGKPVKKTISWITVGLHDTEWRLVSIAELAD